MQQTWSGLLNASTQGSGAGSALLTAATATLSPCQGGVITGADVAQVQPGGQPYGWWPGQILRVTARGFITATATSTAYTFSLNARIGNAGATYVALTGAHAAFTTGTAAMTGIPWTMEGAIRCTAVAASGNTLATQAEIRVGSNPATAQVIGTATAGINLYLPSASGETAAAIDTTQLQGISLRCVQATAGPTVQCTQWLVEALD